jgi:hypothetical protein
MTGLEDMYFYCDESTHLERDHMPYIVLGAIRCPESHIKRTSESLREIKQRHTHRTRAEAKWTRIAPCNSEMYLEMVDLFFSEPALSFRGVVAPKDNLDHAGFGQTHDDWYYKMFYHLLQQFLGRDVGNYIYFDYKDTHSNQKIAKLQSVLINKARDTNRTVIKKLQPIRSHESELLQLADVLIGAVNYANRGLRSSVGKLRIVHRVQQRADATLLSSTSKHATKFNLFRWRPQDRR